MNGQQGSHRCQRMKGKRTNGSKDKNIGILNGDTTRTTPLGSFLILGLIAHHFREKGVSSFAHFSTLWYAVITSVIVAPISCLRTTSRSDFHGPLREEKPTGWSRDEDGQGLWQEIPESSRRCLSRDAQGQGVVVFDMRSICSSGFEKPVRPHSGSMEKINLTQDQRVCARRIDNHLWNLVVDCGIGGPLYHNLLTVSTEEIDYKGTERKESMLLTV